MSPAGRDWLIAAVDPFHDNPLKHLEGWPDPESTPSVVRKICQSRSVSSPLGSTVSYDLYIVQWPFLFPGNFHTSISRNNNCIQDSTVATFVAGGLRAYFVPTGDSLNIATSPYVYIDLDPTFNGGASRLVGLGFEVHDTTSALNQQGTCTVWRQSESSLAPAETWTVIDTFDGSVGTHAPTPMSVHKIRHPPVSIAEALLLPGSRQWKSKDGCYVVSPFCGIDNPIQLVNYVNPLLENSSQDESMTSPNNSVVYFRSFQNPTVATSPYVSSPSKIFPIHQTGACFTSLNPLSTFNITQTCYIETFPTADEKDIVVLATPSASFDPVALEVMSRVLADLPVGVPADWNGFGDWFADIVADVGSFLAPVLTGINPLLGTAAGAATAAANAYRNNSTVKARKDAEIAKMERKIVSNNRRTNKKLAKIDQDLTLKAKAKK